MAVVANELKRWSFKTGTILGMYLSEGHLFKKKSPDKGPTFC